MCITHSLSYSGGGGSLSRGVSVRKVSVQGDLCPWEGGIFVWGMSVRESSFAVGNKIKAQKGHTD